MPNIIQLIEERQKTVSQAREILDKADSDKREATAEETTKVDQLLSRSKELDDHIKREKLTGEHLAEAKKQSEEARAMPNRDTTPLSESEKRDINKFDFMRAVRSCAYGKPLDGIELEMHQEGEKEMRETNKDWSPTASGKSFIMPRMLAKRCSRERRDMLADGDASKGGYTIATEVRGFLDTLENALVFRQAGATFLGGLRGNLELPRAITGTDTDWLGETTQSSEGSPSAASLSLTPRRLAKYIDVSNKLVDQSSIDVSSFVQNYLARKIAVTWEKGAIAGTGANNQPRGFINLPTGTTAGTASLVPLGTDGVIPSRGNIISLRQAVAKKNAVGQRMGIVSNYDVQGIMLATPQVANYPVFLLDENDKAIGTQCYFTNSVPNNLSKGASNSTLSALIYGAMENAIFAQWGGVEVLVDQTTQFGVGKTRIHAATYVDFGVQLPDSFALILDAKTA